MPGPLPTLKVIQYRSGRPGPALLVTGAVHGDETCGPKAIESVIADFESGKLALTRGQVTFVPVVNPKAYAQGTREGDRNMNRALGLKSVPQDFEDHLGNALCPLLEAHDALLDIHSFSQEGEPFIFVGPQNNDGDIEPFALADEERAFARALGVDLMLCGWLSSYAASADEIAKLSSGAIARDATLGVGTTEYMRRRGGYAVTLECGNHKDPNGPAIGRRAILGALSHLRLVDPAEAFRPVTPRMIRLERAYIRRSKDDAFAKSWSHLEPVQAGAHIGTWADGSAVHAEKDGYIVFPYPESDPFTDWFYFGVPEGAGGPGVTILAGH